MLRQGVHIGWTMLRQVVHLVGWTVKVVLKWSVKNKTTRKDGNTSFFEGLFTILGRHAITMDHHNSNHVPLHNKGNQNLPNHQNLHHLHHWNVHQARQIHAFPPKFHDPHPKHHFSS
jgi:hypothetical protein